MVLQKRLDYGFIGYQVPPIPRSTRSPRKRGISWRKADDTQMCAFDLLATVAGKLLLEGESSPTSTNTSNGSEQSTLEKDIVDREKQNNEDRTMQEKSCKSFFLSELVSEGPTFNSFSYVLPHAQNDSLSPKSVITTSDSSDKFASVEKLVNAGSKVEPGSVDRKVFSSCKLGNTGVGRSRKHEILNNGKVSSTYNKVGMCGSDAVLWDRKPSTFVCSDNSVKLTLSKDHIPLGSFPVSRDNVKLGNRDDDENSSATNKASGPALPRIGDQRIKNMLASEYREVNPKSNDEERLNADVETKPALSNKKNNLECERSLRDYPFKKRKLYDCSSVSNSERGISNDGNCSSHTKGYKEDASNYTPTAQKTAGTSNSAAFFSTGDSQVKLRIKSFRVPELFIEIPETSTVGSLKTTVMEAVTAILGGGLHIGVLFQGKKIRDDNKTLLQTGISRDNKLDTLGFSLEPIPSKASPSPCPEERPYLLSCDTPQPLRRYTPTRTVVHNIVQPRLADTLRDPPGTNLINFIESDHDSAPSPPDTSLDKSAADSRALVTVPSVNMEPHSVIPVRKPKRSEAAQRRIRRPFSVSEVEALVQAVEKLGTGRWRDVKLRAFDNAKHRTYVDLKDKWKTLVHTARISPQQRRGEPVPQELLDRVLIAHAYWSQQQAKQRMKQQAETCLLV